MLIQRKSSKEDLGSSKLQGFIVSGSGPAWSQVPCIGKRELEHFAAVWSHNRLPKEPCKKPWPRIKLQLSCAAAFFFLILDLKDAASCFAMGYRCLERKT